jgi:hypothetical protein
LHRNDRRDHHGRGNDGLLKNDGVPGRNNLGASM